MRQGKYIVKDGKFIHQDDVREPFSFPLFIGATVFGLAVWYILFRMLEVL